MSVSTRKRIIVIILILLVIIVSQSGCLLLKRAGTLMDRPDMYETIEEQEARLGYPAFFDPGPETRYYPEHLFK